MILNSTYFSLVFSFFLEKKTCFSFCSIDRNRNWMRFVPSFLFSSTCSLGATCKYEATERQRCSVVCQPTHSHCRHNSITKSIRYDFIMKKKEKEQSLLKMMSRNICKKKKDKKHSKNQKMIEFISSSVVFPVQKIKQNINYKL